MKNLIAAALLLVTSAIALIIFLPSLEGFEKPMWTQFKKFEDYIK